LLRLVGEERNQNTIMEADQFIVRFWGVRGSHPVPGAKTARYGGNTTCVEVQAGSQTLIIDAGTGIINLGSELMRRSQQRDNAPITVTLLFTHMHHDHTQGFPFFVPAHVGSSTLKILGPRTFDQDLEDVLTHAVLPPNFPVRLHEMASLKMVRSLQETEMVILDPADGRLHIHNIHHSDVPHAPEMIAIRIHRSQAHPRDGVCVYRIEWRGRSLVFATDTEGYACADRRLADFARGSDLLIHDAQYTEEEYLVRQGWGHSTPDMACEVARLASVRQLVLFHHDPSHTDEHVALIEREAQRGFEHTIAAYEGLEISL
jgi:phosphoribosyl 1,2-cyclic phosphodiesterase